MGKYSEFKRVERDYYTTPIKPVLPLNRLIGINKTYIEPCAGNGRMTSHLSSMSHTCLGAYDIEPMAEGIETKNALTIPRAELNKADYIITNPPWTREILHPMIEYFAEANHTFLLFDSNWANTQQSAHLLRKYCTVIMPVGRVKWIEGSKYSGKEDCSWYGFSRFKTSPNVDFIPHQD